MPYIEQLGDRWGDLCMSPAIASSWPDRLLPVTARVMGAEGLGEQFAGTTANQATTHLATFRAIA
jgi:hypothetical protein